MEMIPCKRGKGYGSRFLDLITKLADEHSIVLTLEAVPTSRENYLENRERLCRLYERFGFVIKPNPNTKAPKNRIYMERKPSQTKKYIIS
jgi:GNAT superfamily N-acetyltransferase